MRQFSELIGCSLLLSSIAAAAPAEAAWDCLGITDSGLRLFVDRNSIATHADGLHVVIRLGSPHTFVRDIVKIVQEEEIDCAANRWRLLGFKAFDDSDKLVQERLSSLPPTSFVPIEKGSLGATVRDAVCRPSVKQTAPSR